MGVELIKLRPTFGINLALKFGYGFTHFSCEVDMWILFGVLFEFYELIIGITP